jgi:hypothetical protein
MRRAIASTFALVVCTALLVSAFPGGAWADDDICAGVDLDKPLHKYLEDFSKELNKKRQGQKEAALTDASAARPSSDGFSQGGRLDLLRRAFVGLGLGQVTDEEGQLVLNFNPEALRLESFGQFSPRIVVHQAVLDGALDEHIDTLDEGLRTAARDGLKKKLGDLDDVEYTVRWSPRLPEPPADLKRVASELMDRVVPAKPSAISDNESDFAGKIGNILATGPIPSIVSMRKICESEKDAEQEEKRIEAKTLIGQRLEDLRAEIPAANENLQELLDNNGFTRLVDLIEGNPRVVINGTLHQRSGVAGPDTKSVDVTFQMGRVSYWGAKRSTRGENLSAESVRTYFDSHPHVEGAAPLFSLVASYTKTDAFLVPITGADEPFSLDAGHKLSIKGTAGGYFGGSRDRKLELTATYDDVSNDESLHDRFVANLTWVETLNGALAQAVGGSEFVATLVWANKPEFRGEVDEDFGLRAGLKWSLGDGK